MAVTEAHGRAGAAAEGAAVRRRALRLAGRRHRGDRTTRWSSRPAAIELMDRTILELSRSKLEYRRLSETLEGDPEALLFVTFFGDTHGGGARAARPPGGGLAPPRPRLPHAARRDAGRAGGAHQGAQGGPRAADGGEHRRAPAARLRRGHRGGARAPRRLRRPLPRSSTATACTAGFYGHCSVGCLHIRPFVDLTEPGGIETMQRRRRGDRRPRGRLRRRELERARRRPRSQRVQPADLRRRPLPGDAPASRRCSTRTGG